MDNNNRKKKAFSHSVPLGVGGEIAIVVVGIFVLCVIVVLAKGIFSSNSSTVPDGLDTATINLNESEIPAVSSSSAKADDSTSSAVSVDTSTAESDTVADSGAESSQTDSSTDSSETDVLDVLYVTEYAYLHTGPSNDDENIVCMSPGVEVNVLEYEDNGYVKITFQNIDGPLTGYIYQDYLASYTE